MWFGIDYVEDKLLELDETTQALRQAVTNLDNAIQRFSRDGMPPDVLRTSSAYVLELRARVNALEKGETFLPEPK